MDELNRKIFSSYYNALSYAIVTKYSSDDIIDYEIHCHDGEFTVYFIYDNRTTNNLYNGELNA